MARPEPSRCSRAITSSAPRRCRKCCSPLTGAAGKRLEVSDGLVYRDFITVGLLVNKLKIHDDTPQGKKLISDNWIYVQEADVVLGRIQVFNNWSDGLIVDPSKIWLGLEYFCNTTDSLWKLTDAQMSKLACEELSRIGMIEVGDVIDTTVIRMEKTYRVLRHLRPFRRDSDDLERYPNLFPVGRNGMHRYNNQDHSMLTAMMAVDNIIAGRTDNLGSEYRGGLPRGSQSRQGWLSAPNLCGAGNPARSRLFRRRPGLAAPQLPAKSSSCDSAPPYAWRAWTQVSKPSLD